MEHLKAVRELLTQYNIKNDMLCADITIMIIEAEKAILNKMKGDNEPTTK
jgi:hypothetical protein